MKNLISMLMLVVSLTALCGSLSAQNGRQRLNREQLAEAQARHISQEMRMDEATRARFIKTYCQFQKEIWALGPRERNRRSQTDKETEKFLKERFDHSQKILDIRKKYYAIYSEFLTQKQIQRVYELERQMMNRLGKKGVRKSR